MISEGVRYAFCVASACVRSSVSVGTVSMGVRAAGSEVDISFSVCGERDGGDGFIRFWQHPFREGRQSMHSLPDFTQVQFTQRPLPLHRQQVGMVILRFCLRAYSVTVRSTVHS